ncbi:Hsp70 family protein [Gordonia sp. SID5947]|uniref:Hsp70 family protein n=1 Tax=Gordonia sp. SID5947 TaxID=2690315 RepID=UPI0013705ECE|nr:Hsp70 family protein [Gordonia sp. SID5947]MYR05502.1 Hsp70 family protein [Gordonia sp. SID5947]
MATALGITLGSRFLHAATFPAGEPCLQRSASVTVDATHNSGRPTECGTAEENPRVAAGGLTITGFVDRVGDPVPIAGPDGLGRPAEVLTAAAIKSIAAATADRFPSAPPMVVGYPAAWSSHQRTVLDAACRDAGLPSDLRSETDVVCALARLRELEDYPKAGLLAIADLGASGTTVAVVDAVDGTTVGDAVRIEEPAGNDLDHAVMRYVLGETIDDPTVMVAADPNLTSALTILRRRCVAAKEELSRSTVAVVDVDLPVYRGGVRITRTELEDLLVPSLGRPPSAIREILARAGRSTSELTALAAIGGGASVGLTTQHLSGEFHLPILVDEDPATSAARGAAMLAATRARPVVAPVASVGWVGTAASPTATSAEPDSDPSPTGPRPGRAGATSKPTASSDPSSARSVLDDGPDSRVPETGADSAMSGPVLRFADDAPHAAPDEDPSPPKTRRRAAIIVGAAVALVVTVGGSALAMSGGDNPTTPTEAPTSVTTTETPTSAPDVENGVTDEPPVVTQPEETAQQSTPEVPIPEVPSEISTPQVGSGGTDAGNNGGTDSGTGSGTGTGTGSGTDSGNSGGAGTDDGAGSGGGTDPNVRTGNGTDAAE